MASQAMLDSFQKLLPAIDGLQPDIESKLNAAVPVALEFPRVTPEMLGAEAGEEVTQALLSKGRETSPQSKNRDIAVPNIEAGVVPVVQSAQGMASQGSAAVAVLLAQAFSFAVSFGVGCASVLYLESGSLIGPLANALVVTLANVASTGRVLDVRTRSIFAGLQNQLEAARSMLTELLQAIEQQLMQPLDDVTAAVGGFATSTLSPLGKVKDDLTKTIEEFTSVEIQVPDSAALKQPITEAMAKVDALVAEATKAADKLQGDYKDDLQKMTAVEKSVRAVNPDFDIPDPSDLPKEVEAAVMKPMQDISKEAGGKVDALVDTLKPPFDVVIRAQQQLKAAASSIEVPNADTLLEPLNKSVATIKDTAAKVKEEVPTKMDELLTSTTVGTLMTSQWHFHMSFVVLPVCVTLLLNLPVAVLTALHSMPADPPQLNPHANPLHGHPHHHEFLHQNRSFLPEGWLPNTKKGFEMEALKPYYMPAVSQLLVTVLELLLTLLLTAAPVACKLLNCAISSFEAKLNAQINQRIDENIGQIMNTVFDAMRERVSTLTATLKDVMKMAETLLLKAVDMEKLLGEADAAKQKVMSAGKEAAGKVDQVIQEEQEKLKTKVTEMEARIKKSAELANSFSDPSKAMKQVKKFW
eukprot:TRINITY_DN4849_c0_g1_i1.p1 TRINITY_DN4849_c0_g1~~TRINITY_DN4849_c0_g1_i1.p1  ORF type:complete len:666 (+),score=157.58 TRINITY_DN4849_c0_g1_i1:81-2000(+)